MGRKPTPKAMRWHRFKNPKSFLKRTHERVAGNVFERPDWYDAYQRRPFDVTDVKITDDAAFLIGLRREAQKQMANERKVVYIHPGMALLDRMLKRRPSFGNAVFDSSPTPNITQKYFNHMFTLLEERIPEEKAFSQCDALFRNELAEFERSLTTRKTPESGTFGAKVARSVLQSAIENVMTQEDGKSNGFDVMGKGKFYQPIPYTEDDIQDYEEQVADWYERGKFPWSRDWEEQVSPVLRMGMTSRELRHIQTEMRHAVNNPISQGDDIKEAKAFEKSLDIWTEENRTDVYHPYTSTGHRNLVLKMQDHRMLCHLAFYTMEEKKFFNSIGDRDDPVYSKLPPVEYIEEAIKDIRSYAMFERSYNKTKQIHLNERQMNEIKDMASEYSKDAETGNNNEAEKAFAKRYRDMLEERVDEHRANLKDLAMFFDQLGQESTSSFYRAYEELKEKSKENLIETDVDERTARLRVYTFFLRIVRREAKKYIPILPEALKVNFEEMKLRNLLKKLKHGDIGTVMLTETNVESTFEGVTGGRPKNSAQINKKQVKVAVPFDAEEIRTIKMMQNFPQAAFKHLHYADGLIDDLEFLHKEGDAPKSSQARRTFFALQRLTDIYEEFQAEHHGKIFTLQEVLHCRDMYQDHINDSREFEHSRKMSDEVWAQAEAEERFHLLRHGIMPALTMSQFNRVAEHPWFLSKLLPMCPDAVFPSIPESEQKDYLQLVGYGKLSDPDIQEAISLQRILPARVRCYLTRKGQESRRQIKPNLNGNKELMKDLETDTENFVKYNAYGPDDRIAPILFREIHEYNEEFKRKIEEKQAETSEDKSYEDNSSTT